MDHGPSTHWGEDLASGYKTRLGLWMFLAYCIVYAGFVVLNSVSPQIMAMAVGRLNLAIVYGFGLIVLALVMALVYNTLTSRAEERYAAMFKGGNADEEGDE
ncbi:MAG: hypothetical protein BWY76_00951 [bacterium ADurb.Bin429]|nr:MAG: hypothetical protein BWY76_00951 [bacterium ADurb.Bin429]